MPRPAQTDVDPEFWDRLRETLKFHMKAEGLNQRELAAKLAVDPTTLNNFLNRHSKALGGLAVALACTVVDLVCDGTMIGRIMQNGHSKMRTPTSEQQLVLEFDDAFEFRRESERPTIVLRRPAARYESLRLFVRKIG